MGKMTFSLVSVGWLIQETHFMNKHFNIFQCSLITILSSREVPTSAQLPFRAEVTVISERCTSEPEILAVSSSPSHSFIWKTSLSSTLQSSVVIASKNCHHTEQAVLWSKDVVSRKVVLQRSLPHPKYTSLSTYVHEDVFCIVISVSVPQTPGGHAGNTKEKIATRLAKVVYLKVFHKNKETNCMI